MNDVEYFNILAKRLPTDAGEIVAMNKTELANNHIDVINEIERLRFALRYYAKSHFQDFGSLARAALAGGMKP